MKFTYTNDDIDAHFDIIEPYLPALQTIGFYGAIAVGASYLLWLFFLAVMNLKQAKDDSTLPPLALKLGYPILFAGYLLDMIVQLTVANLIFLEPPRELTVSGRIARLIAHGSGWRKRSAEWFRDMLLKPFDRSGGHG